MKMIGIATFINEDNYGALLQAYALQFFLSENGIENEFINTSIRGYDSGGSIFNKMIANIILMRKHLAFNRFRKELAISKKRKLEPEKYSSVIVGSDQVWNPTLTGNGLESCFWGGHFEKNIIAYACSCGNVRVLDNYIKEIPEYLRRFRAISVREQSLEFYLKRIGIENVITVLDPVFLLTKKEWEVFISNNVHRTKEKYIFVYCLESRDDIEQSVEDISQELGLGVISLRNRKHYHREINHFPDADPREFLNLLYNSEVVVTNSFHAYAFSYIFGKKVALFKHSKFNERLDNFSELIGIGDDIYYETANKIQDLGRLNADQVNNNIRLSKQFLMDSIVNEKY